jgi:hypothetical protein
MNFIKHIKIKRLFFACMACLCLFVSLLSFAMPIPKLTIHVDKNLKDFFTQQKPGLTGNSFGYDVVSISKYSTTPLWRRNSLDILQYDGIDTVITMLQARFRDAFIIYNGLVSLQFNDEGIKQIECNQINFDQTKQYNSIVIHLMKAKGPVKDQCIATVTTS